MAFDTEINPILLQENKILEIVSISEDLLIIENNSALILKLEKV